MKGQAVLPLIDINKEELLQSDKFKSLVGLILIAVAFLIGIILIVVIAGSNKANQKKISDLEVRLNNLINERAATNIPGTTAYSAGKNAKQNEGFLWIDRQTKTVMITLGALNGVSPGSKLAVYDGEAKVDSVTVEKVFDVVSYVKPEKKKLEDFGTNYYRVVMDGTH